MLIGPKKRERRKNQSIQNTFILDGFSHVIAYFLTRNLKLTGTFAYIFHFIGDTCVLLPFHFGFYIFIYIRWLLDFMMQQKINRDQNSTIKYAFTHTHSQIHLFVCCLSNFDAWKASKMPLFAIASVIHSSARPSIQHTFAIFQFYAIRTQWIKSQLIVSFWMPSCLCVRVVDFIHFYLVFSFV